MKKNCNCFRLFILGLLILSIISCKDRQEKHEDKLEMIQAWYTCPMPEDSVFTKTPGNCPKCGMELIKMEEVYTCPMHSEVISNSPGNCPKCGMPLELLSNKNIDSLEVLSQPTNHTVISKLKPIVPAVNKGMHKIITEGYITYDPNKTSVISTKVGGRIEKLFVKYNFQQVTKGQKLLHIYSPELLTAQNEYVYLTQSDNADKELAEKLRMKLKNLGMEETDIQVLKKSRKTNPTVNIYASNSGHVHFLNYSSEISKHAFGTNENSSAMEEGTSTNATLKEGDYVKEGDQLFVIANQTTLWAIFKIKPANISLLKKNQEVEVIVNDEVHPGKIDFIEKSFQDFFTVRVYLTCDDHSKLKIGSLIKGEIFIRESDTSTLWVPASSVIDLGAERSVVFLKRKLGYEANQIVVGNRNDDWVQVIGGITQEDSIAPVASYFIDSESFVDLK